MPGGLEAREMLGKHKAYPHDVCLSFELAVWTDTLYVQCKMLLLPSGGAVSINRQDLPCMWMLDVSASFLEATLAEELDESICVSRLTSLGVDILKRLWRFVPSNDAKCTKDNQPRK